MNQLFNLESIRYNCRQFKLENWSVIKVTGEDRESFLQGQLTNDLIALAPGQAQYTARLSRVGKIQSYFILAKKADHCLIFCEGILKNVILDDLNKFIIMDDVEFTTLESNIHICFNPDLNDVRDYECRIKFMGIEATIAFKPFESVEEIEDLKELESVRVLNGYPLWGKDVNENQFINDSYLNVIGISYKKGCFLGQETAAKIENNRGAAYFPVIMTLDLNEKIQNLEIYLDDKKIGKINYQVENILQVSLIRDYRVEQRVLDLELNGKLTKAKISYLPFFKAQSKEAVAMELYHLGVDEFQKTNVDEAMKFMKKSIAFDKGYSDAYESIGVILGRKNQYEEAITWMDQLLEVAPHSVMAHTNKSLFLMKLGKIEEAEHEKGLATVKSFAVFGEEAKMKKALAQEKEKKEADMKRREGMFYQVLEIDADDTVALFGLGDIAFYYERYKEACEYLEKVVSLDEKYSVAYLLLGKSLEASGNLERAMQVYKKGIDVASKRGDMMPANEMQSRLNQLVMSSGLA